jgi:DNA polymerase elongation subunit (family B)
VTVELVSGWVDDNRVVLVERVGDDTRIRALPAKWSAFVADFDDDDRRDVQRMREVTGVNVDGRYTRIDFRDRWNRKDFCYRLDSANRGRQGAGEAGIALLEADVNPLRRLMSDRLDLAVSATPRLGWFDLETDSRATFNEARAGKARVLSWALVDHRGNETAAVLEADTDAAERALIEAFLLAARECDVLLAWNGDGFDFPVLQGRAEAVRAMPGGRHPLWHRWCWLDQMLVYQKYNMHSHESGEEKSSLKLHDVAMHLLGEGKDDFDARLTWAAWAAGGEQRERLVRYNRKDTRLLPAIEAKSGYVALHLAVCHITRCFPDTSSLMASQQGDGFLISLGAQHGYRWPTKRFGDAGDDTRYEGAFVMAPTRLGIVDNTHVCDFASLYPSIMRTLNMSPDTVLYPKHVDPPEGSCRLPFEGAQARFRLDRRGMLPIALDTLVAKRAEYTAKMDAAEPGSPEWDHYKRLSSAFKIVANSFYGIVGSSFTRFFSRDVAEGVTRTGAWLIKRVAEESKRSGLDPFYGDTDSVFVAGDRTEFAGVVDRLNAGWASIFEGLGCPKHYIKLEFEKSFRRLVLVSAKRYAGAFSVYKGKAVAIDKKPEVKGLEYKRGDALRLTREMQRELIGMLLELEVPTVDRLTEFVARWKERVLCGELTVDEIVTSKSVKALSEYKERYTSRLCGGKSTGLGAKKCGYDYGRIDSDSGEKCPRCKAPRKVAAAPMHVRVARIIAERGEEVREGTRIEYLVVDSSGERLEAVPARDDGVLARIDRNYYWESLIYPPSARVLEVSFPDVIWVETAKQKKARVLEEKRAANRGLVADLPLFGRDREASSPK